MTTTRFLATLLLLATTTAGCGGAEPVSSAPRADRSAPAPIRASAPPSASPSPSPSPSAAHQTRTDWPVWALLDRRTGTVTGHQPDATSTTASMIKVWIAADTLVRATRGGGVPGDDDLAAISRMIRYSDNQIAHRLYREGGGTPMLRRMISTCGLSATTLGNGWAYTRMSPRDAVRMGACVAGDEVLPDRWRDWLLNEMRNIHPDSAFGMDDVRPRGSTSDAAIKNGWNMVNGKWHVTCLAVYDRWVLAVETQYPQRMGMEHGARQCGEVARRELPR